MEESFLFLLLSYALTNPLPKGERSEEHTSELQSQSNIVCRLLLEKKHSSVITDTLLSLPGMGRVFIVLRFRVDTSLFMPMIMLTAPLTLACTLPPDRPYAVLDLVV